MNEGIRHSTCLQYLRRKYFVSGTTWDVDGLKALADSAYESATEEVIINTTSSELGGAGGQVQFEKIVLLAAIEELLLEVDSTAPQPPPTGYLPDFSYRPLRS